MEIVKPEEAQGYTVDPDWIPKLDIQTSSRCKRKRLAVVKGMFLNDEKPLGFRCMQEQGVYVVRVKSLDKVDAALALLHLSDLNKVDSDCIKTDIRRLTQAGEEQLKPVAQLLTQSCQEDNQIALNDQFGMPLDQPKLTVLDLALFWRVLQHDRVISETTSISDAVGSCRLRISPHEFAYCDKSLKLLRANIGVRNARLNWLCTMLLLVKRPQNLRRYTEQDCGKERNILEIQMPKLTWQ